MMLEWAENEAEFRLEPVAIAVDVLADDDGHPVERTLGREDL